MKRIMNYGEMFTNEQLSKCLDLVDESYHKNVTIVVIKNKLKYLYLVATRKYPVGLGQAVIDLFKSNYLGGYYGVLIKGIVRKKKLEYVTLFEFVKNLEQYSFEERRIIFIFILFHELRHKRQFENSDYKYLKRKYKSDNTFYERDANEFALSVINKNKQYISEILGIENFDIKCNFNEGK